MDKWYSMKTEGKKGEVRIFDEIGFWGISADDFFNDLDALGDVEEIVVHVNSPGGVITDGNAIYNVLKRHKAKVTMIVEGVAASMASVVVMAGDKIIMPENAFLMIHNPFVMMAGDAEELRHEAELLDKMKKNAIKAYKRKAKDMSEEDISGLMDKQTWISAGEAVEMGFADEIEERQVDEPKKEEDRFDRHDYNQIPAAALCFFRAKETPDDGKKGDKEDGKDAGKDKQTKSPKMKADKTPPEPDNSNKDNSDNSTKKGDAIMLSEVMKKTMTAYKKVTGDIEKQVKLAASKIGEEKASELLADLTKDIESKLEGVETDDVEAKTLSNIDKKAEEIIRDAKVRIADEVMKTIDDVILPKTKNIEIGEEDQEKFVKMSTIGLQYHAGLKPDKDDAEGNKALDEARKAGFLDISLLGYCREILSRNGVPRAASMLPGQVYDKLCALPAMVSSQGSGDFTNAFEDVANKSLADAWANVPTTYEAWTGKDSIPDFRQKNIVRITETGDVEQLDEGQGFAYTAMNDSKEVATLITVGLAYSLTRKAIINDDLNALTDIPTKLGRSVKRYINRRAYTILYGSAMLGPTMNEDSVAMFNSAHNNYVASGSGAAPSAATLSVLRRYMIKQTMPSPDGGQSNAVYTQAVPKIILFHTDLDQAVEALIQPQYVVTGTADTPFTREFIRRLIPVFDPVLDELMDVNSHNGYYLIADPKDVGLINVYSLTGNESPTMRRKVSDVGEPLRTVWDIYYDCQVAPVDFRGAAANYGK